MCRRVKLSKFRHTGTIDAWLNQGQHDSPEQTVKSKFADYFALFLDDITHNIHARFDVYTVDDHLLSKLFLKSPHEGIGNYFTDDEIVQMKAEWPGFKVAMRAHAEESPIALYSYTLRNKSTLQKFPNFCLLIEFMMTISISTASVERIFSIMNLIKNCQRTSMGLQTLNRLLNVKFNTPPPGMLESNITARVVEDFV